MVDIIKDLEYCTAKYPLVGLFNTNAQAVCLVSEDSSSTTPSDDGARVLPSISFTEVHGNQQIRKPKMEVDVSGFWNANLAHSMSEEVEESLIHRTSNRPCPWLIGLPSEVLS
jgi:hypothetical protein